MLFELFKNSMRAVVEHYTESNNDQYPPIEVTVVRGKEDICVKVYILCVIKQNIVLNHKAVSYTHLDVYKRQHHVGT